MKYLACTEKLTPSAWRYAGTLYAVIMHPFDCLSACLKSEFYQDSQTYYANNVIR